MPDGNGAVADAEDVEPLAEILREAERVLDHQVQFLGELDDKVGQTLSLAVGLLMAASTLAAFLSDRAHPWRLYALGLCAGGLWNLAAALHLARACGLVDREVEARVGPDPGWLVERAHDPDWPPRRHDLQVLGAVHNSIEANDRMAAFVSEARAKGLRWLLAALMAYAVVILLFLAFGEDSGGGV